MKWSEKKKAEAEGRACLCGSSNIQADELLSAVTPTRSLAHCLSWFSLPTIAMPRNFLLSSTFYAVHDVISVRNAKKNYCS